ncbi:MAG TPA: Bax inhibitor-1/YccA family protein [Actinomycetes bacterium]
MESRNPVLNREFGRDGTAYTASVDAATLQEMYDRPVTTGRTMSIDDVVVKTGALFALLVLAAVVGWNLVATAPALMWGSLIVAFGIGMVVSFKRTTNPALIMAYSVAEGFFLGGISQWYNAAYNGIVLQAVIGTFTAFAVMLVLYKSGRLRATPRFTKMMTIAMFSYLGIAVVSLFSAFFGVGGGWGFYGVGGIGILLCAAGVALAAFTLVLDFDAIEKGVAAGLPEKESWRAGFGLVVSLVWLYLELLRLLAILQGRN